MKAGRARGFVIESHRRDNPFLLSERELGMCADADHIASAHARFSEGIAADLARPLTTTARRSVVPSSVPPRAA